MKPEDLKDISNIKFTKEDLFKAWSENYEWNNYTTTKLLEIKFENWLKKQDFYKDKIK